MMSTHVLTFALFTLASAEPSSLTPYELDPLPHGVFTASAALTAAILQFAVIPSMPGGLACAPRAGGDRCDPKEVNAFDRGAIGVNDRTWRLASDISLAALGVGVVTQLILDNAISPSATPWGDFLTDSLVVAEATAINMIVTFALKLAVRRPKPNHYTDGAPVGSFDHQLSFPSGHTSAAATVATAAATTFWLRHPDSPWRWVVAGAGAAVVGFTAGARVAGGRHYYTDIIGGTLIGTTIGFLVPLWHHHVPVSPAPFVDEHGGGLSVSGSF